MSLHVDVVFWVLAAIAVASGIAVFRVVSMARATYALAASFIAVGGILLLLEQAYMGVIVVLMMVMEMAIMAVYMVMFMGMNPALMPMDMTYGKRSSAAIAATLFIVLAAGTILVPWPSRTGAPAPDTTRQLGESIMGTRMLVMMTMSPAMFATMVASLVLATSRGRYDQKAR